MEDFSAETLGITWIRTHKVNIKDLLRASSVQSSWAKNRWSKTTSLWKSCMFELATTAAIIPLIEISSLTCISSVRSSSCCFFKHQVVDDGWKHHARYTSVDNCMMGQLVGAASSLVLWEERVLVYFQSVGLFLGKHLTGLKELTQRFFSSAFTKSHLDWTRWSVLFTDWTIFKMWLIACWSCSYVDQATLEVGSPWAEYIIGPHYWEWWWSLQYHSGRWRPCHLSTCHWTFSQYSWKAPIWKMKHQCVWEAVVHILLIPAWSRSGPNPVYGHGGPWRPCSVLRLHMTGIVMPRRSAPSLYSLEVSFGLVSAAWPWRCPRPWSSTMSKSCPVSVLWTNPLPFRSPQLLWNPMPGWCVTIGRSKGPGGVRDLARMAEDDRSHVLKQAKHVQMLIKSDSST